MKVNPASLPIACELFAQWRRARGERSEPAARPFSRDWERLLDDAGLLSAIERQEAEYDVQRLAADAWLTLKTVRYRSHLIAGVAIPLAQELRWQEAFGFVPPSDEDSRRIREFAWVPALAFVREVRLAIGFEELRCLHDFISAQRGERPSVPIKERSLEIFGDEKRLDALLGSSLFRDDRLALEHLRCFTVAEPLGWQRGPATAAPVIVIENAATWDSYCRWNARVGRFSAVVYGGGNRFADSVGFLAEIFHELGGPRQVLYFGDLDAAGLRIPQRAARKARQLNLPPVGPHMESYRWLLELGRDRATTVEAAAEFRREECTWLGELAEDAWTLISHDRRLAQEHVGAEYLWSISAPPARPA